MHKLAIFAVVAMTMTLLLVSNDASGQPKTNCNRSEACTYPDACTFCPMPKEDRFQRTSVYAFNVETWTCDEVFTRMDPKGTCNSFQYEEECEQYCGLDSDENE
uniref:Pancreatic trypsin inhibitor n=1 Tax=Rhipicephalus appendiculatus TaxID=34631 RepID=A0A131YVF6_RHIAP